MTTKAEIIETLKAELDMAASDMIAAVDAFRTAYRAAHTLDLTIPKLGGSECGQRMDADKLHTLGTPAHAEIRQVGPLFDGLHESAYCQQAAETRLNELKSQYPEAFS